MANIGKAFSWITRTLLGTESPANLVRHRGHNSNSFVSNSDANLGLLFYFNTFVRFAFSFVHSHIFNKLNKNAFFSCFHYSFVIWTLDSSKMSSSSESSAESSAEESRLSLDSDTDDSSDSNDKSHRNATANDTVEESFIKPNKRRLKRVMMIDSSSDSESKADSESEVEEESKVNESVIPETEDDDEEEDDDKGTDDDKNETSKMDSDEDVDQNEVSQIHCFSPRTRRSITGRRSILPVANSSNEDASDDDIFASDDEFSAPSNNNNNSSSIDKTKAHTESIAYKSADTTIDDEDESRSNDDSSIQRENSKRNRSIHINDSAVNTSMRTPNPKRFSGIGMNVDDESDASDATDASNKVEHASRDRFRSSTPSIDFSDKSASGADKSSDIEIQSDHSDLMKTIAHNISVVSLNSSDEENHKPMLNSTAIQPRATGAIPKIQPKLKFKTPAAAGPKKFVSRAFHQEKVNELAELEKEMIECQNLLQRLGPTLPDKGRNLEHRCNELKRNFEKKQSELAVYAIEEDNLNDVQFVSESTVRPKTEVLTDWRNELEAIKPVHTGKQGMATHNHQKERAIDRMEKLHNALERCPAETELAPQPNHLGIELMPHQLYAIKWMSWREKTKRPHGGLLADDMGLGKCHILFKADRLTD